MKKQIVFTYVVMTFLSFATILLSSCNDEREKTNSDNIAEAEETSIYAKTNTLVDLFNDKDTTNGKILCQIPEGDTVLVIDTINGMSNVEVKVKANNDQQKDLFRGYIFTKTIDFFKDTDNDESKEKDTLLIDATEHEKSLDSIETDTSIVSPPITNHNSTVPTWFLWLAIVLAFLVGIIIACVGIIFGKPILKRWKSRKDCDGQKVDLEAKTATATDKENSFMKELIINKEK